QSLPLSAVHRPAAHRALHSFPTRRSSDLQARYGNSEMLVITPSPLDPCLRIYPLEEWNLVEETLAARGNFDPRVNALLRLFVGGAHETPLDRLGRMLVAPPLRDHAGLSRNVAFVGSLRFIEMWDTERLRAWKQKQLEEVADLSRALAELGL